MACDCLGPRGDDKSGCRDSWEAYCLTVGKSSTVTSFRENRFNNLFQAAASLHYHREHIREFLSSYMVKKNKKLESVLADCNSDVIDCHMVVLGLLYFRVTGNMLMQGIALLNNIAQVTLACLVCNTCKNTYGLK